MVKFGDLVGVERPERLQFLAERRQRAKRRRFSSAESARISGMNKTEVNTGVGIRLTVIKGTGLINSGTP